MAKVHPQVLVAPSSTSSKQEVFTVWMKSLILSSNGCAVFDSNGRIVYRVDNYDHKRVDKVHVMDPKGNILFTLVKKKFSVLGLWNGYRSSDGANTDKTGPGFRVRKLVGIRKILLGFLRGYSSYKVAVNISKLLNCTNRPNCDDEYVNYIMETRVSKASCRIIDAFGGLVAEVKRKISASGVVLGEDVLTMVVEPHIDHSLVTALVVVFGLIHHKL